MGHYDKRKPLSPDALTRKAYVAVVMRQPFTGGEKQIACCFTSMPKAGAYVESQTATDDGHKYWSERWRVM